MDSPSIENATNAKIDLLSSFGVESSTPLPPGEAAQRAERIEQLAEFFKLDESGQRKGLNPQAFKLFMRGEYDFGEPLPPEPQPKRVKLTKAEKRERDKLIWELYSSGVSAFAIHVQYSDFPQATIVNCIRRNGWKLGNPDNAPPRPLYGRAAKPEKPKSLPKPKPIPKPAKFNARPLLIAARRRCVLQLAESGLDRFEIAERVGLSRSQVGKILAAA